MNKYTTLQIVLNNYNKKWRNSDIEDIHIVYDTWFKKHMINLYHHDMNGIYTLKDELSINDLFSVDSWLMKFVEWKWVDHEWCRNPVEERWGGIWWESYYWTSTDSYDRKRFHLLEMSDLTAEEKVDYFLKNIIDG